MATTIFLDSSPLGLLTNRPEKPGVVACNHWLADRLGEGTLVLVPGIIHYELRRELIRDGKAAGLRRLDALLDVCPVIPITQEALDDAARLWANVRGRGQATAPDAALDCDVILAAQAHLVVGPDDVATIVTSNAKHLVRLPRIDAREWSDIR